MSEPTIEMVGQLSEEQRATSARAIAQVDAAMFPPSWQYDNAEGYYRTALSESDAIVLLLKDGESITGHLLAVPLKSVLSDIRPFDSEIETAIQKAYYVDTIAAMPRHGFGSFRKFMRRLEVELRRRNVPSLAMHARVSSGLSRVVQKYFTGRVLTVRRLERWQWYAREEAADFIEVKIGD